ncbi:CDP-alcohol phosphatidyltransferase family protein [Sinomonas mesophila]|uniref:CDP-alcohol phosphatidyltransferase family protein n=1 Tax=Sinomonas mesophila TaxID=1531955 RepID=UPI000986F91A|nr:CDP-alcohol phosphatidyltransferase family protein [Sinomonas mesophila]
MRFSRSGRQAGSEHVDRDRVLTVPNALTVLRFLGVPLFMWLVLAEGEYGWAVFVLAVMGGTDWVDGYVARRFNQTSRLGRIMDPAADRLALLAVALTLVLAGVVQWWYLAALLVPDLVLGTASVFYFRSHPDLPVSRIGKLRTAFLLAGTPLLVLSLLPIPGAGLYAGAAWVLLGLGLVGHWLAAAGYLRAIVRKGRPVREGRLDDRRGSAEGGEGR